jgi:alpha-tubulin suppressor-like RCC1 family protein
MRAVSVEATDTDWVQLSTGSSHSCGVKSNGTLFCWGAGTGGMLGNNDVVESQIAAQEYTAATDWKQVTAGMWHTCAVKTTGTLFCWGTGTSGQLGHNAPSNSSVPVQEFSEAIDWVQVTAADTHTCAIKANGSLFCWGAGSNGRLGNGGTAQYNYPVEVSANATDWAQVDAGGGTTCAVKTNGSLLCWGMGGNGRLGNNGMNDSLVPVTEATFATNWAKVSLGGAGACATTTDGKLFCWGAGTEGRLGNNGTADSLVPVQEYTAASDWGFVATGNAATCASKANGSLHCWGSGTNGLRGTNALKQSVVPVPVEQHSAGWNTVAMGSQHACGIRSSGTVFCWGQAAGSRLGNKYTGLQFVPTPESTMAENWKQVDAGSGHTCAVKTDGRLFCWGSGFSGRLGHNATYSMLIPVQEYSIATDWKAVAAADSHSCGLKTDGRIFCWGEQGEGRLGNTITIGVSLIPVAESTSATDWAQIDAGTAHTCAVKTGGTLYCWGLGTFGRLGNNSTESSSLPAREASSGTDWSQVSAGSNHTCAVTDAGRLYCWGSGLNGRLGNNDTAESMVPVSEATQAQDWAQVSAGGNHTCAVKADGRLFCWGVGSTGQLGDGASVERWVPVQESTAAGDWVSVTSGMSHTCAAKLNGNVFCWGQGTNGQLGNNGSANVPVPEPEYTWAGNWKQAVAGKMNHTCAVKDEGRLFCWGSDLGKLGLGWLIGPIWPTLPAPF